MAAFRVAPCEVEPAGGCRAAGKSILIIKDKDPDTKDKLVWKWIKGEPTSQAEFGVPTATAQYTLCMYAGTTAALVADAKVPPHPVNWQPISDKGYKYKDKAGTADGIQKSSSRAAPRTRRKRW